MKGNLTFKEWFKTSKKNQVQLAIQMLFYLVFYIALFLENEGISREWLIILSIFITSLVFLSFLRVYMIYVKLLYIGHFNR